MNESELNIECNLNENLPNIPQQNKINFKNFVRPSDTLFMNFRSNNNNRPHQQMPHFQQLPINFHSNIPINFRQQEFKPRVIIHPRPHNRIYERHPPNTLQRHRIYERQSPNTLHIPLNKTNFIKKCKKLEKSEENPLHVKVRELEERHKSLVRESRKSIVDKIKDIDNKLIGFLTCPICRDKYNESTKKRTVLNCSHCFCSICLHKWFICKVSCPICRVKNPTFVIDNKFNAKLKEFKNVVESIDKKIKRKRYEKNESNKRRKIQTKKFWNELEDNNKVKCSYCKRTLIKKNIEKHWWTCPKNKEKPILEYITM